jgi:integrase
MSRESDFVSSIGEQPDVEIPFPLVPEESGRRLTEKQEFDYRNRREKFAQWLLREGKDPEKKIGYAEATAKRTMYRLGLFERFVWEKEDEYIAVPTTDHADSFIEAVAYSDKSQSHKKKCLTSVKRYFKWRGHQYDESEWDPDRTFSTNNAQQPQDYLMKGERQQLREAALEYGTIPSYSTIKCKQERRERLKPYVAEHTEIPADELGVDDWEENEVPSWRYTSMVWASLDTGLRPDEVANAKTAWVDIENAVLRIPKEDSSKNFDNWEVSLRTDTARALDRWLHERDHYPMFDDTDQLWLTTHRNPFTPRSLRRLLRRLCDRAGIEYENRRMSWYSIRHSVGTYMTREEDLAAAQAQLRHKSPETTMKYDAAPVSDRRDALDKMG